MQSFGLRAKILGTTCLVTFAVLAAVEGYDLATEGAIVDELQRAVEALTEAMQVSVQQLGTPGEADEDLLRDYVRRLGPGGIRQITVLSPEKQRVAGSHPHAFLIEEGSESRSAFDLLVPIVVGAKKLGYVEVKMSSSGLRDRLRDLRRERTILAGTIFALALLVGWIMSQRIARPVEALRNAVLRIREGELDVVLPPARNDEVGALVTAVGDMLSTLRERDALRAQLEAQERDALLGRMAASIAHDVRNPLNYLSLAIDHLLTDAGPSAHGPSSIGAQMKAEIARANVRIADFLRLGKPLELHPQQIAVRSLIDAVAGVASASGRSIEVRAGELGVAFWDPSAVEGILRNLVTNAFQASDEAAQVILRAEAIAEDRIAIHVEDRGQGLGDLAHLFEPYYTTKQSGVGIGLVLAQRAAREHGGDLTAENREGGGARFTLTLPRQGRAVG